MRPSVTHTTVGTRQLAMRPAEGATMIRVFILALAFDVLLLFMVPWALVTLLAIGVALGTAAGWAMHVYPRRMVP